ncbi:hypothetical protein KKF84_04705 [Myxococcota bacterium]|nr:hypothetical protein [Myxococcota bacterium]
MQKWYMLFIGAGLFALGLLSVTGCSKKSTPWPEKPMKVTSTAIGGISFSITLPEGVGSFADPAVVIWRSVSPEFAFFIKVNREDKLPDLKELAQENGVEGRKVLINKKVADGVELVVEEPSNKRYTVEIWKTKNGKILKCGAILGEKIGGPAMVTKSNAWVLKICRSLTIQ